MYPPVFDAVNVPAVQTLLRALKEPLRFYHFGMAPQKPVYPYAVWRTSSGTPGNYLSDRPDHDSVNLQIDVYATPSQGASMARAVALALRDAIEGHAYVTSWRGDSIDPDTKNFNVSFDVAFVVHR